jgi:very-short-patch-repair endonuclease
LLDEALFVRRIVTRDELRRVLRRAGGHPGAATLARVLAGHARCTRTDSELEQRMLELIRGAGLPEPELREHVLGYRVDFLWREQRLIVEVDAYGTHGSPAAFERDRRRDARLQTETGLRVIRITRERIEDRPFEVVATLTRAVSM